MMSYVIRRFMIPAVGVLLAAANFSAGATVLIDFETFSDGNALPAGTEITNHYTSWGVTFSSIPPSGATQTTNILNSVPTTSPNNYLVPGGPGTSHGGTLILNFLIPVTDVGSFFIDDDDTVTVKAFDADLNLLTTVYSDGNPVGFDSWSISNPLGISRVEMVGGYLWQYGPKDAWGIDDLSYTPIPEPASLLLLLLGSSYSLLLNRSRRFKVR